ncbi:MAG: toll/interleukin-1 receptor domain-containing protein [Acidobacteriota bacterium]|nr:toll/interleukin-1 receptor domain-containing protein [Acidobacteriota bacterium]
MSTSQLLVVTVVWLGAVAGNILTASERRLFHGAFAAVLVGLAIAFLWRCSVLRWQWWATFAGLALGGAITLYVANTSEETVCMAKNMSGDRVVIGTELTAKGRKYHEENPNDDNNAMLAALAGLAPQEAWTAASIERCRLKLMLTGVLWMPLFGVALVCAVGLAALSSGRRAGGSYRKKKVFISYNHEDAVTAARLRDLLARNKLDVIIDAGSMASGQRIQDFIEQSIQDSDAVVSIVSNSSLLSSWVALETMNSFHKQKTDARPFIGCYLSDDFFRPEFRLECTHKIDERLDVIEHLIQQYQQKKIDPVDLNEEKTRLYDLRNNLGAILATLKGSLCLDLREPQFEESGRSLLATLTRSSGGLRR